MFTDHNLVFIFCITHNVLECRFHRSIRTMKKEDTSDAIVPLRVLSNSSNVSNTFTTIVNSQVNSQAGAREVIFHNYVLKCCFKLFGISCDCSLQD